ncbi:hypothetical protein [Acinetobacter geminorum]|uniref:hypothetical protein n=1 Tax=Acinetobacter geminorum TaxID=2730922 RepID=UPI003AF64414
MEKQDKISIAHKYLSNTISKVTNEPTHELKNYKPTALLHKAILEGFFSNIISR